MTLNGVIAFILLYFTDLLALQAYYITVVEYLPILSAEYRLTLLVIDTIDTDCE